MKCEWIYNYFFALAMSGLLLGTVTAQEWEVAEIAYQDAPMAEQAEAVDVELEDMLDDVAEEEEEECEEDDGPVRLFGECCCGVQVYGWVNFGIYGNADGVGTVTGNAPLGFTTHSDEPMFNQGYIVAEKTLPDAEECGCCCNGWGFRADYIYGTDGPDTQAFGDVDWDNDWDYGQKYGAAIPQLYVEYGNSDCSIKVGHFYTIIGYEVVTAPDNFFYSHAYTMLYNEPFTHTGALLSKTLSDQVSISAGYTTGWDGGFNNSDSSHCFLGSVSWTSCDETMGITYAVTAGDYGDGSVGNQGKIYMHSVVATYQINECMEYVFQSDYLQNTQTGGANVNAGGVNQYLFYTLSDCCRLGLRAEWYNDDQGQRVAGGLANNPDLFGTNYAGGDFYGIAAGVNYTPNANVIVRPEVRYDWFRDGGTDYQPFADGTADEQLFFGGDIIVLF